MFKAENYKIKELKLSTRTPFDRVNEDKNGTVLDMRFVDIHKLGSGRPVVMVSHGTVGEVPVWDESEFLRGLSFKFNPPLEEYGDLSDLDNMLSSDSPERNRLLEGLGLDTETFDYDHKPFLDESMLIQVKLKTRPNGSFKFTCNEKVTPENYGEFFKQDAPITLVSKIGMYFSDAEPRKYGFYFTPLKIEFVREEEKPKAKRTKK